MTVEVGGAGTLGVAFETVLGTYVAPAKYIPIRSESLKVAEDKIYRMNIRGLADRSGVVQGYIHTEGDIVFEVTGDALVYFLYAGRFAPVKTGTTPNFTYNFTPVHVAKATTGSGAAARKTISALVTRGGNPMGYVGLSTGQLAFTLDNGLLICTASMIGTTEGAQSAPSPTWAASDPYGPGEITLEIPTASARGDMETMTFTINDNLNPANRLNGSRFAAYQNWGEREITLQAEGDFDVLTDFNAFMNQTIQAITIKAINNANDQFTAVLNATAEDDYEANLASLGDVNHATINYHAFYNTTDAVTLTVKTSENIT